MDALSLLPDGIGVLAAAALIVTSTLTAAITAAFGLGGGIILLAVLLTVMPPPMAIPVHAVLQTGANASRAWLMRGDILRPLLLWFLPGSLIGVVLGSLLVVDVPVRGLSFALALFILWSVWAPKPAPRTLPASRFALLGAISSFLTMFVGATGPLIAAFLPPERHGRLGTVATHGACMTVQHVMKVIAFALLGFSLADWLALVAAMLSGGFVGTLLGRALLQRLPEALFRQGLRIVLTVLAVKLLLDALFASG